VQSLLSFAGNVFLVALLAFCLVSLLWFVWQVWLRKVLRARRIAQAGLERRLRETAEEQSPR
jgi:hypothetical protein